MIRTLLVSLFLLSACSPKNSLNHENIANNVINEVKRVTNNDSFDNVKGVNDSIAQQKSKNNNSCSINFPKKQEHLTKSICLTLPVKMSDFDKYQKLENGYLNLDTLPVPTDTNEYIVSGNYENTRVLGIIPYDDTRVFLLLISNLDMEGDGFGQTYDLQLYNRHNGSYANGGTTYIGSYSLFYEEPLNYLYDTTQPFKFEDITYLQSVGYCETNFEINKSWEITQHKICKNFIDTEKYLNSTENLVLNTKEMYFE